MDQIELNRFYGKCRFCLNAIENQAEKLNIGELIREKFYEMTNFDLSFSEKLSQMICYECFSLLSRYSAIKKAFIENQNTLNNLLRKCESLVYVSEIYETINENQNAVNLEAEKMYQVEYAKDYDHLETVNAENKTKDVEDKLKEKTFICRICDRCFVSRRTLKNHIDRIHAKDRKYKCDQCAYSCCSSYELTCHKTNNHRSENSKKFLCDICAIEFKQQSCLIRHMKTVHFKQTRFECDKCGYKTFKKENLKKHINTHLPTSEKLLHKCSKCPAELSSQYILKMHMKNIHKQNKKSFQCSHPKCEKSFSREISLKEHQKFVHLKYRPVQCDHCDLHFSSNSHLMRHQKRKHSNSNNLLVNEINLI